MKHNCKVVLLTSFLVCLIATTAIVGCGGAKTGAKSQVYTASFGKIRVTLTFPAEKNSTTAVIEKVDWYNDFSMAMAVKILASYKVDNGSSRPTLCDDYSFGLTYEDGSTTGSIDAKQTLGNKLNYLKNGNDQQGKALVSPGESVLKRLQNTNGVKPGHTGTAYCFFEPSTHDSVAKGFTVTSKETHQTKVMTKR